MDRLLLLLLIMWLWKVLHRNWLRHPVVGCCIIVSKLVVPITIVSDKIMKKNMIPNVNPLWSSFKFWHHMTLLNFFILRYLLIFQRCQVSLKVLVPYFESCHNLCNFNNFTTLESCESCSKFYWTFCWCSDSERSRPHLVSSDIPRCHRMLS